MINKIIETKFEFFQQFLYYLIDYLETISNPSNKFDNDDANLTRNVIRVLTSILPILN